MKFKIGNFIVSTEKKTEELSEQIAVPTDLKNGRPSDYKWEFKTRDITVFSGLNFLNEGDGKYYRVISDLFDFIDLIEILRAFSSNKLDTKKVYEINNSFTAKTAQKNDKVSLKIHFTNYSNSLFLDKFECSLLAAKFSKILQKCEPWQESEV